MWLAGEGGGSHRGTAVMRALAKDATLPPAHVHITRLGGGWVGGGGGEDQQHSCCSVFTPFHIGGKG